MNKFFLSLTLLICSVFALAQQKAKKPSLMVMPAGVWYQEHNLMKEISNVGEMKKVPLYEEGFLQDGDLKVAITTINDLMQERGFPLKDFEQTLKSIDQEKAEAIVSGVDEDPLDMIKKVASADIILELYWRVNQVGPRKSLSFNLRALDAYTNKQIAATSHNTDPSAVTELSLMLRQAVSVGIDEFNNRLMSFFEDMAANGREVALNIGVTDNGPDLQNDEVGDSTFEEFIEGWIESHAVNAVYNITASSSKVMKFEQVRMPLFDDNGGALDVRKWVRKLTKELRAAGVQCKVNLQGLGKVTIILGE